MTCLRWDCLCGDIVYPETLRTQTDCNKSSYQRSQHGWSNLRHVPNRAKVPRSTPAIRALKATVERPSASPQAESTVPHRSATRLSALLSNSPPSSVHYCAISVSSIASASLSLPKGQSGGCFYLFVCVSVCLMKCLIDLNMMYVFCSINGFGYFFFLFFSFSCIDLCWLFFLSLWSTSCTLFWF